MKLYKTGQNKNVAYSTENQKSETDWELAVLLIKETECTSAEKSPNCMQKILVGRDEENKHYLRQNWKLLIVHDVNNHIIHCIDNVYQLERYIDRHIRAENFSNLRPTNRPFPIVRAFQDGCCYFFSSSKPD